MYFVHLLQYILRGLRMWGLSTTPVVSTRVSVRYIKACATCALELNNNIRACAGDTRHGGDGVQQGRHPRVLAVRESLAGPQLERARRAA